MHEHPNHVVGAQEAYSQYNTPRMPCEPYGTEQPYLLMRTLSGTRKRRHGRDEQ